MMLSYVDIVSFINEADIAALLNYKFELFPS
jgi:hypothetical protein